MPESQLQANQMNEYLRGVFIGEKKNRFLCDVVINGKPTECYVPSSCHLGNFIDLVGKNVLLIPTKSNNSRTQYALFAVPYRSSFILLNTSITNQVLMDSLHRSMFSFLGVRKHVKRECVISGYKCDIYIEDNHTVLEIKSVLSIDSCAKFPTVYSQRALDQLDHICSLLDAGYNVVYCIVSLNPYVKEISIPKDSFIRPSLIKAIDHGLLLKGFSLTIKEGRARIKNEISVAI